MKKLFILLALTAFICGFALIFSAFHLGILLMFASTVFMFVLAFTPAKYFTAKPVRIKQVRQVTYLF